MNIRLQITEITYKGKHYTVANTPKLLRTYRLHCQDGTTLCICEERLKEMIHEL